MGLPGPEPTRLSGAADPRAAEAGRAVALAVAQSLGVRDDVSMVTDPVDPATVRDVMGRFVTGVAVVTAGHLDIPHGMTVNSLTSVSLRPPLLLVCLGADARSTEAVTASGRFAVNILSARQEHLARRFAQRGTDHFAGLAVSYGRYRVPVIPDAYARLDCDVDRHFVAGDHVVVIGAVRAVSARAGEPLGFLAGKFSDIHDRGREPVDWFF